MIITNPVENISYGILCENNHQEIARLLQDNRILSHADYYFYWACHFGNTLATQILIEEPNVDANCGDEQPILAAYLSGNEYIFNLLLYHPKVDLSYHR